MVGMAWAGANRPASPTGADARSPTSHGRTCRTRSLPATLEARPLAVPRSLCCGIRNEVTSSRVSGRWRRERALDTSSTHPSVEVLGGDVLFEHPQVEAARRRVLGVGAPVVASPTVGMEGSDG